MELRSLLEPYLAVDGHRKTGDRNILTDRASTPKPLRTTESTGCVRVQAVWHQTVLAESSQTILLEGNHYFPPQDVNHQHLEAITRQSTCSWKGVASYYNVVVASDRNAAAAWFYAEPKHAAGQIRGYVAFSNGVEVRAANAFQ